MATESEESCAPTKLPDSIYDAFRKEGYDPTVVMMMGREGTERTFISEGVDFVPASELNVTNLQRPHVTIQQADDISASIRWCLICNRWGCFWVPC